MIDKFIVGISLVFCIIVICMGNSFKRVKAGPLDTDWHVIGSYQNTNNAAELISTINTSMIEFMRTLRKKYHIDETDDIIQSEGETHSRIVNTQNYKYINSLLDNYNYEVFYENDPATSNDTSYTLSKGAAMYICMRDKKNPLRLVDFNTMMFVILHEASHIANYDGWGHDTKFWTVFKFILHEAVLAGIYRPVNYGIHPVMYCGMNVNYSPIYDDTLPNLWMQS